MALGRSGSKILGGGISRVGDAELPRRSAIGEFPELKNVSSQEARKSALEDRARNNSQNPESREIRFCKVEGCGEFRIFLRICPSDISGDVNSLPTSLDEPAALSKPRIDGCNGCARVNQGVDSRPLGNIGRIANHHPDDRAKAQQILCVGGNNQFANSSDPPLNQYKK